MFIASNGRAYRKALDKATRQQHDFEQGGRLGFTFDSNLFFLLSTQILLSHGGRSKGLLG